MTTEKEYRQAKRLLYICIAFLGLSLVLLVRISYDYIVDNGAAHNIASAIINLALFTVLTIRNRKIVKEYEEQNRKD